MTRRLSYNGAACLKNCETLRLGHLKRRVSTFICFVNHPANDVADSNHLLGVLRKFAEMLELKGFIRESRVFEHVYGICVASPNYGGLGLSLAKATTTEGVHEIQLLLAACMSGLRCITFAMKLKYDDIRARVTQFRGPQRLERAQDANYAAAVSASNEHN